MRLRSLLFVPGDSQKKFEKALGCGADALILDLEDSVAAPKKDEARELVSSWLAQYQGESPALFVRVNALDTGLALRDLAAITRQGLAGVLIPKTNSAADLDRTGHYLDALEERAGMKTGATRLAAVATETALAMFNLASYSPPNPRLTALTWGAEDLAAAIGANSNKEADGAWTFPYQLARAQCLFAASAAGVAPLDTLFANFRDHAGLVESCRVSRRDGFTGRVAIHPDQVEAINLGYTPSADEIDHAKRVVAAFDAAPGAGTVGIDNQMYDIPHLKAAKRTLAAAGE